MWYYKEFISNCDAITRCVGVTAQPMHRVSIVFAVNEDKKYTAIFGYRF